MRHKQQALSRRRTVGLIDKKGDPAEALLAAITDFVKSIVRDAVSEELKRRDEDGQNFL